MLKTIAYKGFSLIFMLLCSIEIVVVGRAIDVDSGTSNGNITTSQPTVRENTQDGQR
jgi:hypothetical protein